MTLNRLLNPRTIAVIGGKECDRVVEQCDKLGFDGEIWCVHPKRETMRGRVCFKSVDDLPHAPDAAYVAVNRALTIEVVAQLSKMGAGGAVCYAAGFAEADTESEGSRDLQKRLIEAAGNMPIIGPNCYGFVNALEHVALWPDQHGVQSTDRGIAILTQSSNVAINMTMQKRALPIACVMTVGNQAQTGMSQLGMCLLEEERVTALGLHIEGLDDVKAFEALAFRARKLGKPIVALKVGKSSQAQAAAMTHTASLAGSDVAHSALFKRLGIARVSTIEVFLETLKLLHVGGPLGGSDVLSLSCSGGEASLMADAAEGTTLNYRSFSDAEISALKLELGGIVTVANPLDYNTFIWGDWPAMTRMFETALAPNFDLAALVMDFPRNDRCDPEDWKSATDSFIAAVKQTGARAAVVSSLPETMPEEVAHDLMSKGIAPLCGLEAALRAAEACVKIGEAWAENLPVPLLHVSDTADYQLETLNEHESKLELAKAGLITPKGKVFARGSEPDADKLQFPVALKALGIAHKSELGAVKLNLDSKADILRTIDEMGELSTQFLMEEMAPKPLAELIVGVTRDPVVGLMLTIGAGGVLTELLADTATLLLPTDETDIRSALADLKIGKLLDGYRDTDAADIDALIANILCIAKYAVANADSLEELDVNPLFATQFGSIAVDALIVKRKPHDR